MTASEKEGKKAGTGAARWLLRETFGNLFLVAILFGIVGRWDWWNGWALAGIYLLWSLGSILFILPTNPQMLAERSRPKAGFKSWDFILVTAMGVFTLAAYVISCLDVRLGWSPHLPLGVEIAALVICVLGYDGLLLWSMIVNAFFTTVIRIQTEREHRVVTGGPYRLVRHPGYLASILTYVFTPLLLGSLWGLIPAICAGAILVVRTGLEDKTLQAELPGYQQYARRTRYRLVPGIW
jgi:protein-S-isoprenylcysteine O-methyltransferase Ste14